MGNEDIKFSPRQARCSLQTHLRLASHHSPIRNVLLRQPFRNGWCTWRTTGERRGHKSTPSAPAAKAPCGPRRTCAPRPSARALRLSSHGSHGRDNCIRVCSHYLLRPGALPLGRRAASLFERRRGRHRHRKLVRDTPPGPFAGCCQVESEGWHVCVDCGAVRQCLRALYRRYALSPRVQRAGYCVGLLSEADLNVVIYKSMPLAFIGRIFEGFATDNLLHYNLNAIFVASVPDETRFSRLVGTSLALYLAGMALSPTLAALLPTFFLSFFLALALFTVSALYLAVFIPTVCKISTRRVNTDAETEMGPLSSLHRPLADLCGDRGIILPGVALLLYNTTLAYIIPALMVYTTLEFAFTSRQNGFLISIAAGVSAFSLFAVFHVFPWAKKVLNVKDQLPGPTASPLKQNLVFSVSSMFLHLIALTIIPLATKGWQMFPLVALLAFGIAAPGFLKNYGVALAADKSAAVASLAMMEILGGLMSVLVLGSWQSWLGHTSVFWAAASLVAAALLAVISSLFLPPCTPTAPL